MSKKRVAYFYDGILFLIQEQIGNFYYGKDHPMKPKRIAMTHDLIVQYGLYKELNVYRSHHSTIEEMTKFHDVDYIRYLEHVTERANNNTSGEFEITDEEKRSIIKDPSKVQIYKIGEISDCPKFPGLFEFCQISTGASIDSAVLLAENEADICINWSGGLHHAKKMEASGFCYVNDIVICIMWLLRYYPRILYVDIDVHHGDGVEEAFFTTNRVMTVSFHQYGDDFFPGSGNLNSTGYGVGNYHSINVPLKPGMNDEMYIPMFKTVMTHIMSFYQPNIVVLQCGTDSLAHDKLGKFNLSSKGHGECVKFMQSFNVPIMLLGGGGYTIQNVSRCWTYETALSIDFEIDEKLPKIDYNNEILYPDGKLHIYAKPNVENKNTDEEINKIIETIYTYLKNIEAVPSVPFYEIPQEFRLEKVTEEEFAEIDALDEEMNSDLKIFYSNKSHKANSNIML